MVPNVDINSDKIFDMETVFAHNILAPGECHYFTTQEFNGTTQRFSDDAFSIIHFNSQSLKCKLSKINNFLSDLKRTFKVIAVTETWLKEMQVDSVQINGYNMFYVNRMGKGGGGVALYVDAKLKCKVVEHKTIAVTDLMKALTIEIINDKGKNVLITCVYRPPGPATDLFTEKIIEMFEDVKNKPVIVCGDFNIDLGSIIATKDFKNYMEIAGLCPMITKPTRITTHSATIIDNIYNYKWYFHDRCE